LDPGVNGAKLPFLTLIMAFCAEALFFYVKSQIFFCRKLVSFVLTVALFEVKN
jgi:hypothetical protein